MQVPWMKWYPADWRSETTLRMVGREARSLWVDLLGIMHEADGFLLIGGLKPTLKQLSQILGDPEEKIAALLHELQTASVCSINDAGVIYSRRMVKDRQKSAILSEAGKSGGNPRLKPTLKPGDKPSRAREPEARSQIPEVKKEGATHLGPAKAGRKRGNRLETGLGDDQAAAVANYWNGMAEENGLPQVHRMTETRRRKCELRLSELGGLIKMAEIIDQIPKQPFLLGQGNRGWRCDFDWILEPSNIVKIEERKFANGHA